VALMAIRTLLEAEVAMTDAGKTRNTRWSLEALI